MGYGARAMELLETYYEGKIPSLVEVDNEPQQEAETVEAEVSITSFRHSNKRKLELKDWLLIDRCHYPPKIDRFS